MSRGPVALPAASPTPSFLLYGGLPCSRFAAVRLAVERSYCGLFDEVSDVAARNAAPPSRMRVRSISELPLILCVHNAGEFLFHFCLSPLNPLQSTTTESFLLTLCSCVLPLALFLWFARLTSISPGSELPRSMAAPSSLTVSVVIHEESRTPFRSSSIHRRVFRPRA
jgi:hypothetical protein